MTKRLLVVFALLGLAVASAKQYSLTLFQPSVLGSTEFKAGDYKVEVTGDKVVIGAAARRAKLRLRWKPGTRSTAARRCVMRTATASTRSPGDSLTGRGLKHKTDSV